MHQIASIDRPRLIDDPNGKGIAFDVRLRDGSELALAIPLADLPKIVAYFLGMTEMLAGMGHGIDPQAALTGPFTLHRIGFQAGQTPDKTLMVLFLAGCTLAFACPSNELRGMAAELSRIATTLSAGSGPPN